MIVIVVPFKGKRFLMVKNPRRGWEFPGGKVKKGETPEEAAKRECREEAGILFESLHKIKEFDDVIVFAGVVKEVNGGEMEFRFFTQLPRGLSYPRDEALEFLISSGFNISNI